MGDRSLSSLNISLASLPGYKHEPLDLREQSFRLVKVRYQPDRSSVIQLYLGHFDLEQDPVDFKALSYTWGPPEPSATVLIYDQLLTVRENLFHFFETVCVDQEFCDNTWLWVDQICIDQSCLDERNHQINQMSTIYKAAAEVIVWLGQSFKGSDLLMEAITCWKDSGSHSISSTQCELISSARKLAALGYWRRL